MVFSFLGLAQNFLSRTPRAYTAFTIMRLSTRAVNMESTTPRARVMAKPRTEPVPRIPSTAAAIRVVTFPSIIADIAFEKPAFIALLTLAPFAISSCILA